MAACPLFHCTGGFASVTRPKQTEIYKYTTKDVYIYYYKSYCILMQKKTGVRKNMLIRMRAENYGFAQMSKKCRILCMTNEEHKNIFAIF
jgi:hypothetical protein